MSSFCDTKCIKNKLFFKNVTPLKITECRRLKYHTEAWGLLTNFYLESVKVNKMKNGDMYSVAMLKVGDRSGQITCIVRGPSIGLLFDLTADQWKDVEKLNNWGEQLFYRYFKNGLKSTFNYEQKLFYNFCMSSQTKALLVAVFRRCQNMRNHDKNDIMVEILELRKCNYELLDLYINHLKA